MTGPTVTPLPEGTACEGCGCTDNAGCPVNALGEPTTDLAVSTCHWNLTYQKHGRGVCSACINAGFVQPAESR